MKHTLKIALLAATLPLIITGCANNPEKLAENTAQPATVASFINEYPTRERVDYVLNCVAQHGGLTYINQYAAKTVSYLRSMAGENGAAFRDPKKGQTLRKQLKEAEDAAEKSCFVK
jgi:basic membrane lipoprotein Med (substrate-binding protein (PBP1-ABC) superfamily)